MPKCSKCGKSITSATMVCDECTPRWIPVSERLPEKGIPVLVRDTFGKKERVTIGVLTSDVYFVWIYYKTEEDGDFRSVYNLCPGNEYITHWMPLPEPPKEVKK